MPFVSPSFQKRSIGYVAAALLVAAAVVLLKLIPGLTDAAQALLLLIVVFFVAWLWESGPGVLAAVLATLAFNFFFLPRSTRSRFRTRATSSRSPCS